MKADPRKNCSVLAALSVIGDRWTMLVLREAFLGVRRFEDLQANLGCARALLSTRLQRLVDHQVLTRVPYRVDGQRERFEYRLTERGHELYPVITALRQWGDGLQPRTAPLRVFHRGCRAPVHAEVRCAKGHGPLTARETAFTVKATRK